jgi:hypothetical protein
MAMANWPVADGVLALALVRVKTWLLPGTYLRLRNNMCPKSNSDIFAPIFAFAFAAESI